MQTLLARDLDQRAPLLARTIPQSVSATVPRCLVATSRRLCTFHVPCTQCMSRWKPESYLHGPRPSIESLTIQQEPTTDLAKSYPNIQHRFSLVTVAPPAHVPGSWKRYVVLPADNAWIPQRISSCCASEVCMSFNRQSSGSEPSATTCDLTGTLWLIENHYRDYCKYL